MTETEKMQWMANGIILTCHLLVSDDLCENKKEAVSTIFSETGITKDEFKMCDDVISKNTIMRLFGGMKTFYREMGWIE